MPEYWVKELDKTVFLIGMKTYFLGTWNQNYLLTEVIMCDEAFIEGFLNRYM